MTATQLKANLRHLGLTRVGAARLFGYDERTVRRWASGKWPVPRIVGIVMWLMVRFKVKPDDVPRV